MHHAWLPMTRGLISGTPGWPSVRGVGGGGSRWAEDGGEWKEQYPVQFSLLLGLGRGRAAGCCPVRLSRARGIIGRKGTPVRVRHLGRRSTWPSLLAPQNRSLQHDVSSCCKFVGFYNHGEKRGNFHSRGGVPLRPRSSPSSTGHHNPVQQTWSELAEHHAKESCQNNNDARFSWPCQGHNLGSPRWSGCLIPGRLVLQWACDSRLSDGGQRGVRGLQSSGGALALGGKWPRSRCAPGLAVCLLAQTVTSV